MAWSRDTMTKAFKARLLQARQAKGRNQHDLAKAAGLGKDIISQYSTGQALPREDSLLKLATALNVKPSDLIPNVVDERYFGVDPAAQSSPFEMRVVPGEPGRSLLRANLIVSSGLALKICSLLQAEIEAAATKADSDLAS